MQSVPSGGIDDTSFRHTTHLATVTAELTRYDSILGIIPDPDILLSPMLTAEAANSSRIEGTRATMSDVLAFEAGITTSIPKNETIFRRSLTTDVR